MRIVNYGDNLSFDAHHAGTSTSTIPAIPTVEGSPIDALSSVPQLAEVSVNGDHGSPERRCSVRGCSKLLPQDAANKMCEDCRGRHRIYAVTKRAKRKLEKAAILSQAQNPVDPDQRLAVWMPEHPEEEHAQEADSCPSRRSQTNSHDGSTEVLTCRHRPLRGLITLLILAFSRLRAQS
ncbi:hypothetical protein BV22DRAFT_474596 [Leucogyrophana mollusca]|uniref:Uncharacterized protein n=1 Tax=Leucogyrophana mollusca TaxID=85980 RepID=A0ACB8BHH0_9AGAM|nr:hypothetical protein BV22DRAFT_474596 [Leucogyrophana mollusca]